MSSGKDESDYKIIDGIEYVKMSRVKMFVSIAKQQAVQKALVEENEDWVKWYADNRDAALERLDYEHATFLEGLIKGHQDRLAELAAAQARKDEREL